MIDSTEENMAQTASSTTGIHTKTDSTEPAVPSTHTNNPDRHHRPTTRRVSQPRILLQVQDPFAPLAMRYFSPSGPSCLPRHMRPFRHHWPALATWPRAMRASMVYVPRNMLQDYPLEIADPEVHDTDDQYRLTFTLPQDAQPDDLRVIVSGRRLRVTATITRENSGASEDTDWWVSRSSRTDSVSRSFILPDSVSSSDVTTSRTDDGKVEVRLMKTTVGRGSDATSATDGEGEDRSTQGESTEGGDAEAATNETGEQPGPSSGDLPGLSDSKDPLSASQETGANCPASSSSREDEAKASSPTSMAHGPPRSLLEVLFDEQMDCLARLVWGDEVLQVPTEEELAARAEAAREERARRVSCMRRSRMATDVVETDGSYVVRMALPEGTVRKSVTLTVTPDKALRVSVSRGDRRPASKEVLLPRDAVLSDVTARFEAEHTKDGENEEHDTSGTSSLGVCGLEVTVSRAMAKEAKLIEIY